MESEALRDWAIIVIAIFMILQAVLWSVLLFVLIRLVRQLNTEVIPVLQSAKDSAANLKATATIVSQTTVQPFIRMTSLFSGVRRTMAVITGFSRRRGRT